MMVKSLGKNFAANGFGNALGLIYGLVSIPIFLHAWGKDLFGEWLVIYSMAGYFGFSELGLGPVLGNKLAILVAQNDRAGAQKILGEIWTLQIFILTGLLAIALGALAIVPVAQVIGFEQLTDGAAAQIIALLVAYVLISANLPVLSAIFRAEGRNATGINCSSAVRIADAVGILGSVGLGASPVGVALVMVLVRIGCVIGVATISWKMFPGLRWHFRQFAFSDVRGDIALGVRFSYLTLGNNLVINGTPIVLHQVLGPAAVVSFTAVRAICRLPNQFYGVVNGSVWPEITRLMALKDFLRVRRINRLTLCFGLYSSICWCLFLSLGARVFFGWWTAGRVQPTWVEVFFVVFPVITYAIWNTQSITLTATNQHEDYSKLYLTAALCSLPAAWAGAHWLGYAGAAASNLLVDLILIPYIWKESCRLSEDSPAALLKDAFRPRVVIREIVQAWQTFAARRPNKFR